MPKKKNPKLSSTDSRKLINTITNRSDADKVSQVNGNHIGAAKSVENMLYSDMILGRKANKDSISALSAKVVTSKVNSADLINNLNFGISTSTQVYGSSRNSFERMKKRSEKLIKNFSL